MIYVVDDEPAYLDAVVAALQGACLPVRGFASPAEALAAVREAPPLLVISDVRMPGLNGFELRTAIAAEPKGAGIPFVFLSSLDEPEAVVQGLEAGADDYLTKPVEPRILVAKVRRLLARRCAPVATFRGELAEFPFLKVLQFCERNAITGELEVRSGEFGATFPLADGLPAARAEADELLARAFDLAEGSFVIRSRSTDFGWLGWGGTASPSPAAGQPAGRPAGRLSAVEVGGRSLQVQTEVIGERVVSVVMRDGRTLLKRATPRAAGGEVLTLEEQIAAQHRAVEAEVRERIDSRGHRPADEASASRQNFYELVDMGFAAYRSGEIERAIELWSRAQRLVPEDPTLEVNLAVARRKLGLSTGGVPPARHPPRPAEG